MHKSNRDLTRILEKYKTKIIVEGIYYHYKKPNIYYKVVGLGFSERDETPVVIYQQINLSNQITWVRRIEGEDGWLSEVEIEGIKKNRFTLVDSSVD